MNKKIMIMGDTHGDWGPVNALLNRKKPDLVLQCGDFGFWPNAGKTYSLNLVKNQGTVIRWCDGNHEDHHTLKQRISDEVAPGVWYMPRGSVFTLPDGRNVLFFGGATSIDKDFRTPGYDWFPEEIISQWDLDQLPNRSDIDIVISHTCPQKFFDQFSSIFLEKKNDPCVNYPPLNCKL